MSKIDISSFTRGYCPKLSKPMQTGDGFLSRVPIFKAITPDELLNIIDLANEFGNGIIDVSAKGNLQIRGLLEENLKTFETKIRELNLPLQEIIPCIITPLSGIESEIINCQEVLEAINQEVFDIASQIAPKVSVIIDGGSFPLDACDCDIRFKAVTIENEAFFALHIGDGLNNNTLCGIITKEEVPNALRLILEKLIEKGARARARELDIKEIKKHFKQANIEVNKQKIILGIKPIDDAKSYLLASVKHGQITTNNFKKLINEAKKLGISKIMPSIGRNLLFIGAMENIEQLAKIIENFGLFQDNKSPYLQIISCPGTPFCKSSKLETRKIAEEIILRSPKALEGNKIIHISGCPKGCAYPKASNIAIAAQQNMDNMEIEGAIIFNGRANDGKSVTFDISDINSIVSELNRALNAKL